MLNTEKVISHLETGNAEVMLFITKCYQNIALMAIKHRLTVPSFDTLAACCDVVEDHMGFRPERERMSAFLALTDARLKARVIEFHPQDTEVRSELLDAVCTFCLGCEYKEGSAVLDRVIAEQWHIIWEAP